MTAITKVESLQPSENVPAEEKKIQYKYLGGRLTFAGKIRWHKLALAIILHVLMIMGMNVFLQELVNFRVKTVLWSVFLWTTSLLATTMGCHRLWSHKAYKATLPMRIGLMLFHTHGMNLTIYKWVLAHKLHHKYTDTDADPHNSKRGFFYAHAGWLILEPAPLLREKAREIDMSETEKDGVVMFQKKYYTELFLVFGLLIPIYFPMYFWGESLYVSAMLSYLTRACVNHSISSINSFAHHYGSRPYDKNHTSVESKFVAIACVGEGWHNYHHAFPTDYRASEFNYLNLGAWGIEMCAKLGLAYDLKTTTPEVVEKKMLRTGDGSRHPKAN